MKVLYKNVYVQGHSTIGVNDENIFRIDASLTIQSGATVIFDRNFIYRDPTDQTSGSDIQILQDATMQGTLTAKRFKVLS